MTCSLIALFALSALNFAPTASADGGGGGCPTTVTALPNDPTAAMAPRVDQSLHTGDTLMVSGHSKSVLANYTGLSPFSVNGIKAVKNPAAGDFPLYQLSSSFPVRGAAPDRISFVSDNDYGISVAFTSPTGRLPGTEFTVEVVSCG